VETIRSLRFWKINAGDEGFLEFTNYLLKNPNITLVDFLDNEITEKSCLKIGRVIF